MDPITDGEVAALDTGLKKVLSSFLSLAMFKEAQEGKVPDLHSLPISSGDVKKSFRNIYHRCRHRVTGSLVRLLVDM